MSSISFTFTGTERIFRPSTWPIRPLRWARHVFCWTLCSKDGKNLMQILLANPRGFCAGVDRAIDIVERAVTLFGAPIYVRHEVVHNKYVVDRLRTIGAVFVEELTEVPDNATVIFSAHGVPRVVQQEAKRRSLNVFDATCPLVTKVHMEITRYAREAREVFLIGHAGHPEVEGTIGQFDATLGGSIYLVQTVEDVAALKVRDPKHVAFVTQTTLSVDDTASIVAALRARFPDLKAPVKEDICYATQNRQDAVKDLIGRCEVLVVVGSKPSSNSTPLREMPGKNWSGAAKCWWSWARNPAPIPIACAKWPARTTKPDTWWTARKICTASGSAGA